MQFAPDQTLACAGAAGLDGQRDNQRREKDALSRSCINNFRHEQRSSYRTGGCPRIRRSTVRGPEAISGPFVILLGNSATAVLVTADRKCMALNQLRSQRGFTIVEAIIAIVVLMIVALGLLAILPTSFNDTVRDSERVQAVAVGQQYLDALTEYVTNNGVDTGLPSAPTIAIDPGDVMEGSGAPADSPGNFTLTNNGCPAVAGSQAEFDCVATVTWTEHGASRSVQVESYVTSQKN